MQLHFQTVSTEFTQVVSVRADEVKTLSDLPHFVFNMVCSVTAKPLEIYGRFEWFNSDYVGENTSTMMKLLTDAMVSSIDVVALKCGCTVRFEGEPVKPSRMSIFARTDRNDLRSTLNDILKDAADAFYLPDPTPGAITRTDTDLLIKMPVTKTTAIILNTYGRLSTSVPVAKTSLYGKPHYLHIQHHDAALGIVLLKAGFLNHLDHLELQREVIYRLDKYFPWFLHTKDPHWTNAILDFNLKDDGYDHIEEYKETKDAAAAPISYIATKEMQQYLDRCNFMANPVDGPA